MRSYEPVHVGVTHLAGVLEERARRTPEAIALLAADAGPLTYARLAARVRAGADRLAALGVRRDDRVVVPAGNTPDCAVTLLAVMNVAVCCPVEPGLAQDEFEAYFDVLEPSAVLLAADAPERLWRAAATTELAVVAHDGRLGDGTPQRPPLPADRWTTAPVAGESVLLHTSGTTSAGKIVPLTMAGMLAAADASADAYHLAPGDRRLNLSPLSGVQGLVGGLVTTVVTGSSMVCAGEAGPRRVLRLLRELEPTWFSASPMAHRALLDEAGDGPVDAPCLRFARSGAAAMPAGLRAEVEARLGVPLIESYGMSEASQIASDPLPPDGPARGMVPSGSHVAVLTADGTISTAPGAHGEILVRGGNVIERYVWPPAANEAFVDGWLRTGDLGGLADDGSLTITGRAKELINHGGDKVSPLEVEEVLLSHPAVGGALVFGVPDGPTEHVAAAVVPRPGRTVDEAGVRSFAVEHLAAFKVPERVVVCDALPLGPAGKPVRRDMPRLLDVTFGRTAATTAPHHALRPDGGRPEGTALTGRPAGTVAAPRTPVQAALAGLWAFALGRPRVGVNEDFFDLGGDPVSADLLVTAVGETLGAPVTAADLCGGMRTVELMARAVEHRDA